MTVTATQARELKKRIKKLLQAEVEHTLKGTENAIPFRDYDENLRVARKRCAEYIEILRLPDGRVKP